MNRVLWLTAGIAIGFVVAHQVNQTSNGRKFFTELDSRAKGLRESVADGYRERESELRTVLTDTAKASTSHVD